MGGALNGDSLVVWGFFARFGGADCVPMVFGGPIIEGYGQVIEIKIEEEWLQALPDA